MLLPLEGEQTYLISIIRLDYQKRRPKHREGAYIFQKRQPIRHVNTMSKKVSHLPRSISATWKARSAKKVQSLVVSKSKPAVVSFFETIHACIPAGFEWKPQYREGVRAWRASFAKGKKLFRGEKMDDGEGDEKSG